MPATRQQPGTPRVARVGQLSPRVLGIPAPPPGRSLTLAVPPCVCDMGPTRGYYDALIKQSVRKSRGSNPMGIFKARDKNDQSVSQNILLFHQRYGTPSSFVAPFRKEGASLSE